MRKSYAYLQLFLGVSIIMLVACDQNVRSIPEGDALVPPVFRSAPPLQSEPVMSTGGQQGEDGVISGTISLSPELSGRLKGSEVLFIMARRGGGAPLAVKRVSGPKFPMSYTLTSADQMVQGTPFSGIVEVVARIDGDGNAGPLGSGDMEGGVSQTTIGEGTVDIVIDRAY